MANNNHAFQVKKSREMIDHLIFHRKVAFDPTTGVYMEKYPDLKLLGGF
jgi:hypothetical protein